MDNYSREQETLIDEALDHYEAVPLPPAFVSQVMAQLEASAPVQFRLDFLDWAIPTFAALFTAVLLFFLSRWDLLSKSGLLEVQTLSSAFQRFNFDALVMIGLIVLAEVIIAAAVVAWLWRGKPGKGFNLPAL